jgi:cyclophilin family peptidyl-prolyl cis-trans isomerase
VRLTIVGGLAQFGDLDLMQAMKGDDLEVVQIDGEFDKALDVTYLGVDDGSQTWEKIVEDLEMAMRFDRDEMYDYFGSSFDSRSDFDEMWTTGSYSVMHSIPLDGIFTWGDDRYFNTLNNSFSANHQISFSQIYDDYYSVAMDDNGNRAINLDWQPGTTFDGKAPASEILVEMTLDWTDNEGTEKSSEIHLELYPDKAPIHVDNFVSHIENGTYDGTIFHRVIDDFMMQGGDFTDFSGSGGHAANWYGYCKGEESTEERCAKEDWTIPDEADNGLNHLPFVISMAKTQNPNTGGSQFFITEVSSPHLDGIHTVFGKVVAGSELITAIQSVETNNIDKPLKDVTLTEIKIVDSFTTDEEEEPVVSDPGKDDSIIEGGTCNAGETKPPDNADCRYCVCLGDNTWKCDSGECKEDNEDQTATESAKSGGLSNSSLVIGGVAILLFILTILLTVSNSPKNKDNPWDNPPEDLLLEQVPSMPPLEGGPPKA